ncbi:MAG: hypothetical protein KDI71_10935 [Xanthomonadales bacterium]|nr:hypothetical protein [Xanthomonadales bacterium]
MTLTPAKLTTYVLGGACGLFLLIALLQTLGIGAGYSLREPPPVETLDTQLQQPLISVETELPSYGEFAEVEQRPLFSADRRPQAIVVPTETKPIDTAPPAPLSATLAGIVLTPTTQVALVRDNSTQQVNRIRVGMPLPGEMAGWRLKELAPRHAVFDGGSQGEAELKLDPADAPMAPPPPPAAPATPGNPPVQPEPGKDNNPNQQQANDAAAREAEVRRIIEERRRQMREEAERMNRDKK